MDEEGELLDFLAHPPFGVGERSAADDRCLLNVGQRVDVWIVTGLLGRGGQGEVYRAVDDRGLPVAIKILRRMESAAWARFTDEVRTMMWVGPSVLPQVYAEGQWNDHPYVVMELLEPVEIPTEERTIAGYLISVCTAVAKLHRQGLVHRDLKPANIMQRGTGNIVLVDVGLAKDIARMPCPREGVTRVEGELVGMGTPGYAAPEQLTGGEISVRTDIHALGMLARTAFQLRAEERGRAFAEDEIPRVWRPILARATSSVAEQRYASVGDLEKAIRRRHLGRWIGIGGPTLLSMGILLAWGWNWWSAEESVERRLWARLCETVVTNRIPMTIVSLRGTTNVFKHPILLSDHHHYQIVGPGRLDGTFVSAGTNTDVRLKMCSVYDRTQTPLERGGVFYRFVGRGTDLNFPNLKNPWPKRLPPQYPRYDPASNHVRYGIPAEKEPELLERKGELSSENF